MIFYSLNKVRLILTVESSFPNCFKKKRNHKEDQQKEGAQPEIMINIPSPAERKEAVQQEITSVPVKQSSLLNCFQKNRIRTEEKEKEGVQELMLNTQSLAEQEKEGVKEEQQEKEGVEKKPQEIEGVKEIMPNTLSPEMIKTVRKELTFLLWGGTRFDSQKSIQRLLTGKEHLDSEESTQKQLNAINENLLELHEKNIARSTAAGSR